MLTTKHAAAIVLASLMIVGWNLFLIQRDAKLFESYHHSVSK